jgi:predicted metalloprotease with PDZ domain
LFCLLADVEIRERTGNRLGLRDALVALVESGWTITRHVRIEELLARMDATVGGSVLSDLYAEHKDAAVRVDLAAMWKRLGVVYERGRVTFDDTAPGSAIRQAITR